jgi:hypothetical protein
MRSQVDTLVLRCRQVAYLPSAVTGPLYPTTRRHRAYGLGEATATWAQEQSFADEILTSIGQLEVRYAMIHRSAHAIFRA